MRTRRLQFGVAVLVAAATAGLLTQLGLGGNEKVQIGNGSVSVLAHAARVADKIPQSVLDYPFADRNFASPNGGGSRLLQEQGSLKLYAVPGKGVMLCLVEVDTVAGTAGGACADRDILRTGSIYMADRREDGSRLVVGLVGDGHTYAEANGKRAPVQNNAFVLNDVEGGDLTVGSPSASQHVDIGG
ncbi:MAG: hypothetical protein M3R37_02835 [Actinomycetota bacterium]|nr:hypothetical protein [Actinomycetota bacterium]